MKRTFQVTVAVLIALILLAASFTERRRFKTPS
jgi:predicted small secreted protein